MANVMGQTLDQTIDDITDLLDMLETKEVAVEKLGFEWEDFIHKKATEIIEEEIIKTIQWRMRMWNFSPKIIKATYLDRVTIQGRGIRAYIKSDYISKSGFPVSVAREKGTKKHWIEPHINFQQGVTINYQTGQITHTNTSVNQSLPKALHWESGGKHFFSKGHMVSGIPALKLITKTIRENKRIVKDRLKTETQRWVDDILS